MKRLLLLALLIVKLCAIDYEITGFGTLGGTISDSKNEYLRFIDNDGTIKSNSIIGLQTDVNFTEHWGLTLQGKVEPSIKNDTDWDPTISWAFLSFRPTNDWLFRLGKFRLPLYLNSQNIDVGITYNMVSLPIEVYKFSPSNDGIGLDIVKNFSFENSELSVESFYANTVTNYRFYVRDDLSSYGGLNYGANFHEIEIDSKGIAITYELDNSNKFRLGYYRATGKNSNGQGSFANSFSLQPVSYIPGMYAYQADGGLKVESDTIAVTLGMELNFQDNYKLTAEYAYKNMIHFDSAPNMHTGYVSLSKKIDDWDNFITFGIAKSEDNVKEAYKDLYNDPFNNIVASNRQYADSMQVFDQKSYSLGTAYSLSSKSKIKAQWTYVQTGDISNYLFDNDNKTTSQEENLNIFSLSYNFVF